MSLRVKFLLLFLSCSTLLLSQNEIVRQDQEKYEDLILKKRGPNLDYYGHLYFGYGFLIGDSENDSAQIKSGKSSSFSLGWLSKKRINKWYEIGFDVSYYYSSFHIQQDSFKIVPNNQLHKKEKMVFNNIQLIPFQRFKLRNKYHSTGIFIDLGGFAGYNYRIKHQTVERNQAPGAGRTKTVNQKLSYTEDFSYGAIARLGFNRFVFYGRYRFSNLFHSSSNLPELPRFDVGLTIGIHQ
ncbi:MAG: hypothetical protein KDB74_07390 [Flavobacteriales bacterium]|nr:hypothetical protein [Flavobacteriales bacterium]